MALDVALGEKHFGSVSLAQQDERCLSGRSTAERKNLHRDAWMFGKRCEMSQLFPHDMWTARSGPQRRLVHDDPEVRRFGRFEDFSAPHAVVDTLPDVVRRVVGAGCPEHGLGVSRSLQDARDHARRVVADGNRLALQLQVWDQPRRRPRVRRPLSHACVRARRAEDAVALDREGRRRELLAAFDLADVRLAAVQGLGELFLGPAACLAGGLDLLAELAGGGDRFAGRTVEYMFNSPYSNCLWNPERPVQAGRGGGV